MSKPLGKKLEEMEQRLDEIERQILDPKIIAQNQLYAGLLRQRGPLVKVVEPFRAWKECRKRLEEAEAILSDETADGELRQLAEEEIPERRSELSRLREDVKRAAIVQQSASDRDVIIEVRAGTGGEEAALFAADLVRMYGHYAERHHWSVTQLDARPTDLGGFKEITLSIAGEDAFRRLRFESGGHRVQRVPTTEAQGRIHTSLVTVAVLPEAEAVDVEVHPSDVEMSFFRASGPGGQKVNKTSSAVRLVHRPTGIEATCQESPSQHKNRAHAMRVLRTRLFEHLASQQQAERAEERRILIGSGDRNERIRTYNFPQNRVTDHRIGLTLYDLRRIMDGELDELIKGLMEHELAEREKDLQLE